MNVYATVDEIKLYLGGGLEELQESDDDALLMRFAIKASRMFDNFATNGVMPTRRFYPTIATKDFDHPDDTALLSLRDDLLECTTLTTDNGGTTILAANYELQTSNGRYNQTPYSQIRLHPDGTVTAFEYDGTPYAANAVTGLWGYHNDWADAWEDSGDSVQDVAGISSSDTTITVTDADGDDINGLPTRFKIQQILKIEDEYLWLTDVNGTDNELTVRRGMNGSTAATHALDTAIYVYRPMDDIIEAMELLSTYIYRRKDSIGSEIDRPMVGDKGQLIMPQVLPSEVMRILRPYRKEAL